MKDSCDGTGKCYISICKDSDFYITNAELFYKCAYNCNLIECKNYALCLHKIPKYVLEKNEGICNECCKKYGISLKFVNPSDIKDDDECNACDDDIFYYWIDESYILYNDKLYHGSCFNDYYKKIMNT